MASNTEAEQTLMHGSCKNRADMRRSWIWILALMVSLPSLGGAQEETHITVHAARTPNATGISEYAIQGIYPEGSFIIRPDHEGRMAFDSGLAYSLLRALDSVRSVQGVRGVSASILIPGQGAWLGASGVSSTNPLVNVDPAMLFGIGSNTKAFVSTTILKLAEAGLLSLDDPLSRFLPSYPNVTGSVTIRQLLNMTSGLYDYLNDSNAQGDSVEANPLRLWAPEELITTFVGAPNAPPGGAYAYCNTNYVLLGLVINRVTGRSVSSQIREQILTPLALNHTYLEVEEQYTDPVAHPWDSGVDFSAIPVVAHFSTLWTAGGILSTAENMARWSKALYEGTLITEASRAQMLTLVPMSSTAAPGFVWNGYGLGVRQGTYYGKRILGHGGSVMGYVSIVAYLPGTGCGFAVLFNASEASGGRALTALLDVYLNAAKTQFARAGVCYAISGTSEGCTVYLADTTTGVLTAVGPSYYGEILGARVHPQTGVFWGLVKSSVLELVHIDGQTGEAFPRMKVKLPSGAPTDLKGLDFSPDGKLYVGSVDGRIYAIDTASGAGVLAASSNIPISGLAFDPADKALWASVRTSPTLRDRIYRITLSSGDTVGVGNTKFNQAMADLAFDSEGNLFALVGNPTSSLKYRLARIDKGTGIGTEIGSVGLAGMVGIAFSPKSLPTDVALLPVGGTPAEFRLEQNYPNPFNPSTTIHYVLPSAADVMMTVTNVLGQQVAVLTNGVKEPGHHEVRFDGSMLASGVYICRMHVHLPGSTIGSTFGSGSIPFVRSMKMLLVR
jgi:D-alanyl-D-alanine carboxypeptidase